MFLTEFYTGTLEDTIGKAKHWSKPGRVTYTPWSPNLSN